MSDKTPRDRFVKAMRDLLDRHYGDKPEHREPQAPCAIRFYGVERAADAFADAECFSNYDGWHSLGDGEDSEAHAKCRASLRAEIRGGE